jgi:predicted nuclease of predicted toxin-antitoxin system
MARLYADEQFPFQVVECLRELAHDVLTVQEAGKANQRIPDDEVLEDASSNERAVLTLNRRDFKRLHRLQPGYAGIIVCTDDSDRSQLAQRIHAAILAEESLTGKLIRVVRDRQLKMVSTKSKSVTVKDDWVWFLP